MGSGMQNSFSVSRDWYDWVLEEAWWSESFVMIPYKSGKCSGSPALMWQKRTKNLYPVNNRYSRFAAFWQQQSHIHMLDSQNKENQSKFTEIIGKLRCKLLKFFDEINSSLNKPVMNFQLSLFRSP